MLVLASTAPLHARRVAAGTAGSIRIGFTAVSALTVLGHWIGTGTCVMQAIESTHGR